VATSVTLGVIMASSSHYSIDSPTDRAHVSAARGKGGSSKSPWPHGTSSPASFTVWLMDGDGRSPSTLPSAIKAVIRGRSNRRVKIERFFERLKINRAIAI